MKTIQIDEYEYDLILTALRGASVQCGMEGDSDTSEDMNLLADRLMNDNNSIPDYYGKKSKVNGKLFKD